MDWLAANRFGLEHRHNDGSWSQLEEVPHDSAGHDPERSWLTGHIFRCRSCEEEVRVVTARDPDAEVAGDR